LYFTDPFVGIKDRKTLYIPALTSLYRIRLSVRGASLPGY